MNGTTPRVVYDCNIYVQALINLDGPASRCVESARQGKALLFVSPFVLAGIREIHEKLPSKYGVTAEQTDALARYVASFATIISDVPELYRHPFDPDDSHYVNLAAKTQSRLIVSRDRHLLNLMDNSRSEAQAFQSQFPSLRIIDPVEFLRTLDQERAAGAGPK
jgi:putative PIN family toxin of toxin-antitoxin system